MASSSQSDAKTESVVSDDKIAAAPFNLASADVKFRTSDNVVFRLSKYILSIASPFFNDMFSLAPPGSSLDEEDVIPVTEDSETFDALLRLPYPVADPPMTDRLKVEQMLEAAIKYQLEFAIVTLRNAWHSFIPEHALAVFATACRLRLHNEARLAADAWKLKVVRQKEPIHWHELDFAATLLGQTDTEEIARISAGQYSRLLTFLQTNPSSATFDFIDPPSSASVSSTEPPEQVSSDPDIILRSRDGVDIPAHRLILQLASATKLLERDAVGISSLGHPVHQVDADAKALRSLISLCYPFYPVDSLTNLRQLDTIMPIAQKYEIKKMIKLFQAQCAAATTSRPFLCYFLATKWGWAEVAREAVSSMSREQDSELAKESDIWVLEDVTAEAYIRLIRHHHAYWKASIAAIKAAYPSTRHQWQYIAEDIGSPQAILTSGVPAFEQQISSPRGRYCTGCASPFCNPSCRCLQSLFKTFQAEAAQLQKKLADIEARVSTCSYPHVQWSHMFSRLSYSEDG